MLITKENLEKLLSLHPEKNRELIKLQMQRMTELIIENNKEYNDYSGYSNAIDDVLKLIMQGKFVEGE